MRLEALEGIAAFHGNDVPAAAAALHKAHSTWQSLQVSDDGLMDLIFMGFSAKKVRCSSTWIDDCTGILAVIDT